MSRAGEVVLAPRELVTTTVHESGAQSWITHLTDVQASRGGRFVIGSPDMRCRNRDATCFFVLAVQSEVCNFVGVVGTGHEDPKLELDRLASACPVQQVQRSQNCSCREAKNTVEGPFGGDVSFKEFDGFAQGRKVVRVVESEILDPGLRKSFDAFIVLAVLDMFTQVRKLWNSGSIYLSAYLGLGMTEALSVHPQQTHNRVPPPTRVSTVLYSHSQ